MSNLNDGLDALARPELRLFGRPRSAFHVLGTSGLVLGISLGAWLTLERGLSLWVLGAMSALAVLTFVGFAWLTLVFTGEERLVYYRHEIAILSVLGLALWLFRQPVTAYLDVAILGIGGFLAFGRVGCFMVGCCHGVPHSVGVRYGEAHVHAGFSHYLAHVRLLPIQLIESTWVFAILGVALTFRDSRPGELLAFYVVVYDLGRFCFEFFRGDGDRPYYLGFSEAQWISLLLLAGLVALEISGGLPFRRWHLSALLGLSLFALVVTRYRAWRRTHALFGARHVQELAQALVRLRVDEARAEPRSPMTACTSLGIRLSCGAATQQGKRLEHVTFSVSEAGATLPEHAVVPFGQLLVWLSGHCGPYEVVSRPNGINHVLFDSADTHRQKREHSPVQRAS